MKNILFFYTSEIISKAGGVENVTEFWYQYFTDRGYNVHIIFWKKHPILNANIPQIQLPDEHHCYISSNVKFMKEYLNNNNIDVVINQAAINNKSSLTCTEACIETQTHLISVLHNTPDWYLRSRKYLRPFLNYRISKLGLYYLWYIIQRCPGYKGGKYIYDKSTAIVVLSPNYVNEYYRLNVGKIANKVFPIANPLTFSLPSLDELKENIVLFVGRLSQQKAVDILLYIWQRIELMSGVDDWKLVILGDGPERYKLQLLTLTLNLKNIEFVGHTDPTLYYRKAKIMCMTSIYEGLPMTLIESQAYGVVPIISNSFSAASDIIIDGLNGFLIPSNNRDIYVKRLFRLMEDNNMRKKMQIECRKKAKLYDAKEISSKWFNLMNKIFKY